MPQQSVTDLFGAGATLSNGVLTIDFTAVGRDDGVNTPASISATKAADVIIKRLAGLTAANDVADAAIAGAPTPTTPQYIATRGGTVVTQLRASRTIYSYYSASDPSGDPDNLV